MEFNKSQPLVQNVKDKDHWTEIIEPYTKFDLRLADVWRYHDLVMMFARRDLVSTW
jgi:lipopolysaccharide transport system permease protein